MLDIYYSNFYESGPNIGLWLSISDDNNHVCCVRITTTSDKYTQIYHPDGGKTLWNRKENTLYYISACNRTPAMI
jgi:hypothetical protein